MLSVTPCIKMATLLLWDSHDTARKDENRTQMQVGGQRREEGEANNELWSMTQALWWWWWSGSEGGGGMEYHLYLSHNHRSTADTYHKGGDNSWPADDHPPCTPIQTTPPSSSSPLTTMPRQALGSCPSTWLRPSQGDPPALSTKRFLRTQAALTTTENTPQSPLNSLLNICLWTGHQMLLESWHAIIWNFSPVDYALHSWKMWRIRQNFFSEKTPLMQLK